MTGQRTSAVTVGLLPCPLCRSFNIAEGVCYVEGDPKEPAVRCLDCGCRATLKAWNARIPAQLQPDCGDDENRMDKISALISRLQSTLDQFGDTCVYIRRGGLSWGAVALNRHADDQKHGVFDLQAQHDRDMAQRAGQVERLIADRNRWMERAFAAEKASAVTSPNLSSQGE